MKKSTAINKYLKEQASLDLLRFITCGSVDDGKSTLIGRMLYESQMIFDDQVASLKKDSQKHGTQGEEIDFALLVDGLSAEREQGITIDVAYRFFSSSKRKFIVADTPGHEQYTRNMATGASTADLAILLVDARNGVMTQTKRHSFIVSLLGIKKVILAINKMDLVNYDQKTYQLIDQHYRSFAKNLNFDQINEFNYIADKQEVQFSFPFDWEQETIDQSSVVHEEILIPKTFGDLLVSGFAATLNGIELDTDAITIDDFNSDERIVHIVVSQSELQEIFDNNNFDDDKISIHVKPSELNLPLTGITENGQFKINLLSGFSNISPNSTALLEFEILDVFLKDKPMQVSYELKILHQNNEIFSKSGTSSGVKSDPEKLEFFVPTDVSGVIDLQFESLADSDYARLSFPVAIQSSLSTIPDWVKNTAGWWANGEIPDSAFVNGIQYLIKEGIIVLS